MSIRLVVFDFDGTLTNVEEEAKPFTPAFRAALGERVGQAIVEKLWPRFEEKIRQAPLDYGWQMGGKVVAPGTADPYLMATNIAQLIEDELGLFKDPVERQEINQGFYKKAYETSRTCFKAETRGVLEALIARQVPVVIVSNSKPEKIDHKLADIGLQGKVPVHGNARKFVLEDQAPAAELPKSPEYAKLAESQSIDGLARPIYLRRPYYFSALEAVRAQFGNVPYSELLVVGDIYELDLALPAALGANVHFVRRAPPVLQFELDAIRQIGAPRASEGALDGALKRFT